jgi:hypothetical protein
LRKKKKKKKVDVERPDRPGSLPKPMIRQPLFCRSRQ